MNTVKSMFVQIIKRKESLLILVIIIAGITLCGWLFDNIALASFSLKYKPVSPIIAVTFIVLSILIYIYLNFEKSRLTKSLVTLLFVIITLFYFIVNLGYVFNFAHDIENVLFGNLNKFGNGLTGYMSPIAAIMFFSVCISILSGRQNYSDIIKYIGSCFAFSVFLFSSVLLIAYLYNAPLLFGSKVIPVALPATVCFFIFSIILLRIYELKFRAFNMLKDNTIALRLLKSFLPIVIFAVIVEGLLITNISVRGNNPTLSVALVLFFVVALIVIIVLRASIGIGNKLLRAEQAVIDSEKRLSFYTDNSPMAVVEWDTDFIVTKWTGDSKNMFGWSVEETIGKQIMDLNMIYESDIPIVQNTMEELTNGINDHVFSTNRNYRKDRSVITCKWYNTILKDENGKMLSVLSQVLDISEQKKIMAQLQASKDYLDNIINSVGSPVFVKDDKHKFIIVNTALCLFLNLHPEELIGKTGYENFPIDQWDVFMAKDKEVIDTGKENVNEEYITDGSGEIRTIITRKTLYTDVHGNRFLVGIINDITELKHVELKIQQQNIELTKLNADKDRFISILGHDLKSPFNNILGFSEILTEDIRKLNTDEIEDIAKNIYKSAKITNKLLEDILMWARTQQGSFPFKPQNLSLSAICRNILEILNPGAYAKNITIYDSSADHINV